MKAKHRRNGLRFQPRVPAKVKPAKRRARFELLEPRFVLAAPTLAALSDLNLAGGAPLFIPLNGFDADGDALTYEVSVSNSTLSNALRWEVPQGNRSLKLSVAGYGDMVFELFEDKAPETTGRIIDLVASGYYTGVEFHRVSPNFVIQAGIGSYTPANIDDEFHPDLQHTSSGILSMATAGDDTGTSQFFITDKATRTLGANGDFTLDFSHSVFGRLVEGDDVREAIQNVTLVPNSETPATKVVISSATIFTDNENGVLMLALPDGTTGSADVTVTVRDAQGVAGTPVKFQVSAVADDSNSPPFLGAFPTLVTQPNKPLTFQVPAQDIEGDPIYYSVVSTDPNLEVTSVGLNTGQVTVTPKNGATGVFSLRVRVSSTLADLTSSSAYGYDQQIVNVKVSSTPTGTIVLATSADTGVANDSLTRLNNNSPGNALTFRVMGWEPGAEVRVYAGGTLIGSATAPTGDGAPTTLIVTTDGENALADGMHTIYARQVVGGVESDITDSTGASAQTVIEIDSQAALFTSSPLTVANQGAAYLYDVNTSEEGDAESGIKYSLVNAPQGMSIDLDTGVVQWSRPTSGGPFAVTVRATDAAGNTADQSYDLAINLAPVIAPISAARITEENELAIEVSATDPEGHAPLLYELGADAPDGATINSANGVFRWTPTEMQGPDDYTITVKVSDAAGATSSLTFQVHVDEKNELPMLDEPADRTAAEGSALDFFVSARDGDLPDDVLHYSLRGNVPAGAAIDASTGRFTWTPNEQQGGRSFDITVRVTDKTGDYDEATFRVDVSEVDQAPVFDLVGPVELAPGETLELQLRATDPDDPARTVVYLLEPGAPAGAALDPTTGLLRWSVPEDQSFSTVPFTVRAVEIDADGQPGLSQLLDFEVNVTGLGDAAFNLRAADASERFFTLFQEDEDAILPDVASEQFIERDQPIERPTLLADDLEADTLFDSRYFNAGIGVDAVGGGDEVWTPEEEPDRDSDAPGLGAAPPTGPVVPAQVSSRQPEAPQPSATQRAAATDEALADPAVADASAAAASDARVAAAAASDEGAKAS